MSKKKYDFSGWATVADLQCSDGRVITEKAFAHQDGKVVPLVWNHVHDRPDNVIGNATLKYVPNKGMYTYGSFNRNDMAQYAKECLAHGDITALSIWANRLDEENHVVKHGEIREVSLVYAGANPGAFIQEVLVHSDDGDRVMPDEAIIYTGKEIEIPEEEIEHAEEETKEPEPEIEHAEEPKKEEPKMAEEPKKEKTIGDIFETLTEEQKKAVYAVIGLALEDQKNSTESDGGDMKHNVFDDKNTNETQDTFLSHDDMKTIVQSAKNKGSLKDAFYSFAGDDAEIIHSIDTTGMDVAVGQSTYGINDMDMLFPDYRNVTNTPGWIKRDTSWVGEIMNNVHKSPFTRIRSIFANITEDEARARGYIKGSQKVSEVFSTLKRTTDPQTIYKVQKFDRDDVIDITDFDVIAWVKGEMRIMLDEEIARAILIGDGRESGTQYKIDETHIRPIANDVPLFTIKKIMTTTQGMTVGDKAAQFIDEALRARKGFKGTGSPILFTTEDLITEILLLKDTLGHYLYDSIEKAATKMRVRKVVPVEVMEGATLTISDVEYSIVGVIVNPADYNVGCNKGGQVTLFDDFDINFNKYEYLIETRMSGALVTPYSAIVLLRAKEDDPDIPSG